MFLVGQVSGPVQNLNIEIFSDSLNVINVEVGMMLLLGELYLFVPLSVSMTIFQGYRNGKQFQLKKLCSYLVSLKVCRIVK